MPDAIRTDILEALESTLEGITTGAGYRTTLANVDFAARDWVDVGSGERNWVGIVAQDETITDFPQRNEVLWRVDLVCHLTPSTNTPLGHITAIADLMTDIKRAIYASNGDLGVVGVHYVRIVSKSGTESAPAAVEEAIASAVIGLEIKFFEDISDT